MIIWRDKPVAKDHPGDPASCKWSSGGTGLLQMIIRHPSHHNHLSQDLDSISRTFLEQFALVTSAILYQTHALSYIAVLKDYFKLYHLSGHSTCSSSSATTGSTCFKKKLIKNSFTDHWSSQHSHKSLSRKLGICKWGAVTEGLRLAVFCGELKISLYSS